MSLEAITKKLMKSKLSAGDPAEVKDEPSGETTRLSGFHVMVAGHIESAQFLTIEEVYCRYAFSYGHDWRVINGVEMGLTQMSRTSTAELDRALVWNFPMDVTFKSTNPHGWPRLVLSVYGLDAFGRDVVKGYGSVHVPTQPGNYVRYIRLFAPCSSSGIQELLGTLFGSKPEFYDAKFIAQNEGREVTRVRSYGVVKVVFNVMTRGLEKHGYSDRGSAAIGNVSGKASVQGLVSNRMSSQLQNSST